MGPGPTSGVLSVPTAASEVRSERADIGPTAPGTSPRSGTSVVVAELVGEGPQRRESGVTAFVRIGLVEERPYRRLPSEIVRVVRSAARICS